ncbi:hypothetical protein PGTUg99_002283 [Puccinia graminis f. sp. tritici]|uniref:DUF6589 domain-containing protein n=1 Tax=Puccinia graminis f. sp. tritici TaxID=56615 RepID=A0A5B0LZZ1_PUCGR|nr:hypothetical protein PGTUg99_002283 [Puccinia graminis f. sp. tritici]
MLTFACNRRHNGLQLENSIRFYACGVSETVNEYLHYLGLTSHRKTAVHALRSLACEAQDKIASCMAISTDVAPILCIDNLDMEERIQIATVGKQNRMFHGTWGYIHIPSSDLMDSLNPNDLTLTAYHNALKNVSSLVIDPNFFLPNDDDQEHHKLVVKSQIVQVMYKYVARPSHPKGRHPLHPPEVELISHKKPEIHMLKLMNESDNSAEGIGQVMDALQHQTRLDPADFFGRLQLIDGDLGTAQIFNAIRVLRSPSEHCDHSLNNISFTLGAAHTLWNIAHTILTYHFGNSGSMDDLGVWRYLEALGIPPEKVAQKKDFTKMLQYMEQVHEATLWYCLRDVMGHHDTVIQEELPIIPTAKWNYMVDKCYDRFFSHEARRAARGFPKLSNLLTRLQDFSTVIEANRAMKRGDIGRLINVWKMWSIMTQSLPGLTHYSAYLPRLILLLTKILPPSLGKLIRHSILVSPSGRPNHFVAKDFLLETHNYWLKYFYTQGGIGTQIDRLQALFSSNIPTVSHWLLICNFPEGSDYCIYKQLRTMFDSLRLDSGAKHIQQSHKPLLTLRGLERFQQMAQSNGILTINSSSGAPAPVEIKNTYIQGLILLQEEISTKANELGRFTMHLPFDEQCESYPSDPEDQAEPKGEPNKSPSIRSGSPSQYSMDED